MKANVLAYGELWTGTHAALICAAARRLGYSATVFDFYQSRLFAGSSKFLARAARRIFKPLNSKLINQGFCDAIEAVKPTTIIVSKGVDLYPETLSFAKALGIKLINWSPDDYLNHANSSAHLINSLSLYDLLVSARPHRFDIYRQHGARALLYIDWYYIPEIHYPRATPKDIRLGFIGSWSRDRESAILQIKTPCTIHGWGWDRSSAQFRKRHIVVNKVLNHDEYPFVLSRTMNNLNFFTKENYDRSNQRLFEVPACGSALVSEYSEVVEAVYGREKACITFKAPGEIDSLLKSNHESEAMALRGRCIVESGPYNFTARFASLVPYIV